MPIYEYLCEKCNQITEVMQKFSDKPLTECPHCGGKLKKQVSLGSFSIKGESGATCPTDRKSPCCPGCTHNHG